MQHEIVMAAAHHLPKRSQPTTSSSIIATLAEGTDLCVVFSDPTSADGYTWYSVATLDAQNPGHVAGEFYRIDAIGGCSTCDPHDRIEVSSGPLNPSQAMMA